VGVSKDLARSIDECDTGAQQICIVLSQSIESATGRLPLRDRLHGITNELCLSRELSLEILEIRLADQIREVDSHPAHGQQDEDQIRDGDSPAETTEHDSYPFSHRSSLRVGGDDCN